MSYKRPTCQRPVLLDAINGGFLSQPSDAELRTAIRWALVTIDTQQAEIERLRAIEYNPAMFCEWICDYEGMYVTGCERAWEFVDGDLSENGVRYCPFCGGRVTEPRAEGGE